MKIILYKYYNSNKIWGGEGWSVEEKKNYTTESTSFYVEIPDEFKMVKTKLGGFFINNNMEGYVLETDMNKNPYLLGVKDDIIYLKVLGKVEDL